MFSGLMKILSKKFIKKFKYNILNIHPSLLIKYKGLNTHERVIQNKDRLHSSYSYWKIRFEKIILQKRVKFSRDNAESLILI